MNVGTKTQKEDDLTHWEQAARSAVNVADMDIQRKDAHLGMAMQHTLAPNVKEEAILPENVHQMEKGKGDKGKGKGQDYRQNQGQWQSPSWKGSGKGKKGKGKGKGKGKKGK